MISLRIQASFIDVINFFPSNSLPISPIFSFTIRRVLSCCVTLEIHLLELQDSLPEIVMEHQLIKNGLESLVRARVFASGM